MKLCCFWSRVYGWTEFINSTAYRQYALGVFFINNNRVGPFINSKHLRDRPEMNHHTATFSPVPHT